MHEATGETCMEQDTVPTTAHPRGTISVGNNLDASVALLSVDLPPPDTVLSMLADAATRSEQLEVLQQAWCRAEAPITTESAAAVLGKLNKADSRSEQLRVLRYAGAKLSTLAALDAAMRPIVLTGPQFHNLSKLVQRTSGVSVDAFAALLDQAADDLGRFLSAAQAAELVARIAAPPDSEFAYWHVACSRVTDRWRVNECMHHSAVCCAYGWDTAYTLMLAASRGGARAEPAVLQSMVLSLMGHGDDPVHAHASSVAAYAQTIAARQTGGSSSSSASCSGPVSSCTPHGNTSLAPPQRSPAPPAGCDARDDGAS